MRDLKSIRSACPWLHQCMMRVGRMHGWREREVPGGGGTPGPLGVPREARIFGKIRPCPGKNGCFGLAWPAEAFIMNSSPTVIGAEL